MKNSELFHQTVGILVKAYQNETLVHSDCQACAVGNLVAHYKGIKLEKIKSSHSAFITSSKLPSENSLWYNLVSKKRNQSGCRESKKQIDITGYTVDEIIEIEKSFEEFEGNDFLKDEDGYLGLMSVVDCLIEIHESTTEEANQAKELFVKV